MNPFHDPTRAESGPMDLDDSDIHGLGETYRPVCAQRRWAAEEANRVMRQTLQRDIRKAKRVREPARPAWARPAIWLAVLVAGPFAWALLVRLAGD